MLLLLLILIIPVLVYLTRLALKESREFTKAGKISRLVFILLLLLFVFLLIIKNQNYYLAGYRSTSIVYLCATIAGIVYALCDRRPVLTSFKRVILNLAAVVLMMGAAFLFLEIVDDYKKQLVYSTAKYRIEFTIKGPMARCGLPDLFIKKGLLERKANIISPDTCITRSDIANVSITDADSNYLITYILRDNENANNLHSLRILYSKP